MGPSYATIDQCVWNATTETQDCTNTDINSNYSWIKTDGYNVFIDTSVSGFVTNKKYTVEYYFLIGSN